MPTIALSGKRPFGWLIPQLRIPIRTSPLGSEVQDRPQRRDIRRVPWVLARIGHFGRHLACPEQSDLVAFSLEDCQSRTFASILVDEAQIVRILVADRLDKIKVTPAALAGEGELTFDRAAAEDLERHPLLDRCRLRRPTSSCTSDMAVPVAAHTSRNR